MLKKPSLIKRKERRLRVAARSHQLLKSVWEISSWCWPGSVTEGALSPSRGWLRRFLLLKLVTVLLFPPGAGIPLLVGCMLSLRALLLLRSPRISTKPSNVLLGQLALSDCLVLLQWVLWLGATLAWWMEEVGYEAGTGLTKKGDSVWWREAAVAAESPSVASVTASNIDPGSAQLWMSRSIIRSELNASSQGAK
ncbi:uncharacterized protein AKAME5_001369500, partial [Lates japonicus]